MESLVKELQKSNKVIGNQLKEYINKSKECQCSCHMTPVKEKEDERLKTIEKRIQGFEANLDDLFKRDKEKKKKLTSLLERNTRLKATFDAVIEIHDKNVKGTVLVTTDINNDVDVSSTVSRNIESSTDSRNMDESSTDSSDFVESSTDSSDFVESSTDSSDCVESSTDSSDVVESATDSRKEDKRHTIRKPNIQALKRIPDTDRARSIYPKESLHRERVRVMERRSPCLGSSVDWDKERQLQKGKAPRNGLMDEGGIQTVICLDTSASMSENNAWRQACIFLNDYINGLEREGLSRDLHCEHVAFVIFGEETTVLQHLTTDFSRIRKILNCIEVGGHSPLFEGLKMTATVWYKQVEDGVFNYYDVDGIETFPKIVLITDGQPTDTALADGPDEIYMESEDTIKERILELAGSIKNKLIDLFYVPVGDGNKEFVDILTQMTDGIKLSFNDGQKLARRTALTIKTAAGEEENPFSRLHLRRDELNGMWSEEEKLDKMEIVDRSKRKMKEWLQTFNNIIYNERLNSGLPAVGTRVIRGADWLSYYGSEDGFGTGTIIGHATDESKVWVNWDETEKIGKYRCRVSGEYDLRIVHEYRTIARGHPIAIGCKVHPGRQWQSFEMSSSLTGVAVSIQLIKDVQKTKVKWNNGLSGWYIVKRPEEIVICGNFSGCTICGGRKYAIQKNEWHKNIQEQQ